MLPTSISSLSVAFMQRRVSAHAVQHFERHMERREKNHSLLGRLLLHRTTKQLESWKKLHYSSFLHLSHFSKQNSIRFHFYTFCHLMFVWEQVWQSNHTFNRRTTEQRIDTGGWKITLCSPVLFNYAIFLRFSNFCLAYMLTCGPPRNNSAPWVFCWHVGSPCHAVQHLFQTAKGNKKKQKRVNHSLYGLILCIKLS